MKAKLEYCLQWLRDGAVRVARSYPIETLLALYACVWCLLTYELDWSEGDLFKKLALVPLFFALALAVNNLAGRGPWRKVYWVVWAPIVPLTLWIGLGDWIEGASYRISLGILAPLLLLLSLRAVRNDRFVNGALVWLRSGLLALLFANVALGLFYAILYSTTYIFGLDGAWIEHVAVWAVVIVETLAVPVLFLMMADRWQGAELRGNRILEVLLNYIVTPALLIYTAILYLYMAKILFTWSLPEGGVAYLVFGFTITALAVKAVDQLLGKRIYNWFFDRFSLVSLPMLVLFWIGVMRRTNEYGLTEPRVYLFAGGGTARTPRQRRTAAADADSAGRHRPQGGVPATLRVARLHPPRQRGFRAVRAEEGPRRSGRDFPRSDAQLREVGLCVRNGCDR